MPILRDMLCLLALTAALWAYHIFGRTLPTGWLVAAWLVMTGLIAAALFWRSRIRRRAFLAAYVASGSVLRRWLRGGWLMALRQSLLAGALALVLAVSILRLADPWPWLLLIAAVPVLVLGQTLVRAKSAAHVSAEYLPELSWRITLLLVGAALLAALVAGAWYRTYPDFAGVTLDRAVWHLVDREEARSGLGLTLLQMAAAKDALRLWLAQQLMPQPGVSLAQLLGWLLVLAEEGLFVWSYLLMCTGVLIGVNRSDRADG